MQFDLHIEFAHQVFDIHITVILTLLNINIMDKELKEHFENTYLSRGKMIMIDVCTDMYWIMC